MDNIVDAQEVMEIITFILGWVGKWLHSIITRKKYNNGTRNKPIR